MGGTSATVAKEAAQKAQKSEIYETQDDLLLKDLLLQVFANIPNPSYRTTLKLHLEGFKLQQIKKILGVQAGTANAYLFRGRQAALEIVKKDQPLFPKLVDEEKNAYEASVAESENLAEYDKLEDDNPLLKEVRENSKQIIQLTRKVDSVLRLVEQLAGFKPKISTKRKPLEDILGGERPCPFLFQDGQTLGDQISDMETKGKISPDKVQEALSLNETQYQQIRNDELVIEPKSAEAYSRALDMEKEHFYLYLAYTMQKQGLINKKGN